jgi:hypothetical protein
VSAERPARLTAGERLRDEHIAREEAERLNLAFALFRDGHRDTVQSPTSRIPVVGREDLDLIEAVPCECARKCGGARCLTWPTHIVVDGEVHVLNYLRLGDDDEDDGEEVEA